MNNDLNLNNLNVYYNIYGDGGGIEVNSNHMQKYVVYEDTVSYDNHNVFTENEGVSLPPKNQLYECVILLVT